MARGDLLEYLELGGWFRRVKDPILLEFLKVWGKIEVEGLAPLAVQEQLEDKYQTMKGRINEYKGCLAEVHMSKALLNSQNMTLPNAIFNMKRDVQMPDRSIYVANRMRLSSGKGGRSMYTAPRCRKNGFARANGSKRVRPAYQSTLPGPR